MADLRPACFVHRLSEWRHAHVDDCAYKQGHPGCTCLRGFETPACPGFHCWTSRGRVRPHNLDGHSKAAWEHEVDCIYLIEQMGSAAPLHPGCECDTGDDPACPAHACPRDSQLASVFDQSFTQEVIQANFSEFARSSPTNRSAATPQLSSRLAEEDDEISAMGGINDDDDYPDDDDDTVSK